MSSQIATCPQVPVQGWMQTPKEPVAVSEPERTSVLEDWAPLWNVMWMLPSEFVEVSKVVAVPHGGQ